MKKNLSIETKGLIDTIIERFMEIMSIKPFQPQINDFLRNEYTTSLAKIEDALKPRINFVANEKELSFLNEYVFQNLQSHATEVGNKLRQEIQRGILNKETPQELKKRVQTVFADSNYSNRLKTVMRTEKLRSNNAGAFEGAQQAKEAGINLKKYLHITMDKRTSDICKHENKKYGTKEEAIPIDTDFVVKVDNKTYKGLYPPWHPNCRTIIRFIREAD